MPFLVSLLNVPGAQQRLLCLAVTQYFTPLSELWGLFKIQLSIISLYLLIESHPTQMHLSIQQQYQQWQLMDLSFSICLPLLFSELLVFDEPFFDVLVNSPA